jgi:branched-chain amino acid transport system permease protein
LVTGPSGTEQDPYAGFRAAWLSPRLAVWAAVVVAVYLVTRLRDRWPANRRLRNRVVQVTRPVTALGTRRLVRRGPRTFTLLALVVALVLPPLVAAALPSQGDFWQTVLVDRIGIYVLLALGLNVVVGYAGLLDLGYIAFFAIGAYTAAYWTGRLPVAPPFTVDPLVVIPIAMITAMIAGVALGAPTLRLRGDYLAIVTLGFGEIVRIVAVNANGVTNGPRGAFGIPHYSLGGFQFALSPRPYYYLLLALICLAVLAFSRLERSALGRAWMAVREDEVAAKAAGVPALRVKLLAFAIGASTAGAAGSFYADKVGFIAPDNFLFLFSLLVLVYVIFGGMGSIPGVILGAAVIEWLPQFQRDRVDPQDRFVYFGALVVIMMIFRPQGIVPSTRRARELTGDLDAGEASALPPKDMA